MGLAQIKVSVTLTEINCGECGGTYAINERYRKQQYKKGRGWHCPYCDTNWGYFGDNEADRQRRRADRAEESRKWYSRRFESEKRSHAATKGTVTKIKNRIRNGVCPLCNRHFANVERHMASKHKEKP